MRRIRNKPNFELESISSYVYKQLKLCQIVKFTIVDVAKNAIGDYIFISNFR